MSGGGALLSAIANVTGGRDAAPTVRRGRYLSLLAPTLGSALLVWDLHTPRRFYNMLRVAKATSPMSIGTWLLMGFSASAGLTAGAQFLADRMPWRRWPRRVARVAQIPAAVTGAGLSTYTAALLASTSTPLWAAAPQALAVRFGSSSIAAGAAALSFRARRGRTRRSLDTIALAALAVELAATRASHRTYERRGVAAALDGGWGQVERLGATGLGTLMPLGLHAASLALARQPGNLSNLASLAVMAGSLLLRVSVMAAGDESANRPEVSFRFSQPENLPETGGGGWESNLPHAVGVPLVLKTREATRPQSPPPSRLPPVCRRLLSPVAHVGFRGVGFDHRTSAAMRAPSRALPRRRALCTNWKKPR